VISASQDKTPERGGNDGADGKGEENQKQVSLAFPPRPWKSLPRFPHSHRADNGFPCSQNQNERNPWLPTFICSVQAHSSMRICWERRSKTSATGRTNASVPSNNR
jgi:hypothetical protein